MISPPGEGLLSSVDGSSATRLQYAGHPYDHSSGLYTIYSHSPLFDGSVGGSESDGMNTSLSMANLASQLMQSSSTVQRRSPTPASLLEVEEEEEEEGGDIGPGWLHSEGTRGDSHPPPTTTTRGGQDASWPRKAATPARAWPRSSSGLAASGATAGQSGADPLTTTRGTIMRGASSPQLNVDPQLQRQRSVHETRSRKSLNLALLFRLIAAAWRGPWHHLLALLSPPSTFTRARMQWHCTCRHPHPPGRRCFNMTAPRLPAW